jgi:acetylornithine/N-succinyldiaminopimelate aminotransferase
MSTALRTALLPTYPEPRVAFVEGDGVYLTDATGRTYLDFAAGIAVVGLGHRHPAPLAAAHAQLDLLWHASNLFATDPARVLAQLLSEKFATAAEGGRVFRPGGGGFADAASSQGAQAFFCNSGSEANEAALKYARKATGRPGVLALEQSFHGRTLGALGVTGQPSKRAGFVGAAARFVPPNDVDALRAAMSEEIGLVLLEPVLGEGGVIPLEPEFVAAARELDALLAFDEVQTGVGRTGTFFAFEQHGVVPDLVTLAKGLANGLPIGCLLVAERAVGAFAPGDHGSTFGGNPVSCAAALAVCETVDDELLASVRANGKRLLSGLAGLPHVLETRGRGLLVGAQLDVPAQPVADAALDAGLVCLTSGAGVLRLAPPLVIDATHVDTALSILTEVLTA